MRQKIICELCRMIGHKSDSCIIRGPKFLPPSIIINMNQFRALSGEEPNEPPREWNRQTPESHFRYITSPPKFIPMVSSIMDRLSHHSIDNVDVDVHPSNFTV